MTTRSRRRLGQAMLEYSLLTWLIAMALFAGPFVRVPNPKGNGKTTVFSLLMDAYQIYNNSYYFALCAPMP